MLNKTYIKTILLLFIDLLFSLFLIDNVKQLYYLELNINIASTGLLITAYTFSKFIFEIPTGFVSDKYGRKISVIIGILVIELSLVFLFFDKFILLFISSVLLGVGRTFISGSFDSMIFENISTYGDKKIKIVQNINRFLWYGGYGIGIYLSGILYENYKGKIVVVLTILVQFLAVIILFIIEDKKQTSNEKISFISNIRKTFENKYLLGVIFSFVFFTVIDIPFDFYKLIYLKENGLSVSTAALIMGIITFVSPLTGLLSISFSKKTDIFNVRYGFIAPTACLLLIGFFDNIIILVILMFLKAFLFSLIAPSRYIIQNRIIDDSYRATALSISSFLMALCSSIFVSVFAFFSEIFTMKISIMILSICAIMLIILNSLVFLKGLNKIVCEKT